MTLRVPMLLPLAVAACCAGVPALARAQTPAPVEAPAAPDSQPAALQLRVEQLEQRLAALERRSQAEAGRTARLLAAALALQDGQPLGEIDAAPPALARFAHAAPPTLAALRLAFPAAAQAAAQASQSQSEAAGLGERVLQQLQTLVTIRAGSKLLVGAPAAGVLAQAAARLEAGDLAGTLSVLEGLDPIAAHAMAGWRGQAQALLEARAALAGLAGS